MPAPAPIVIVTRPEPAGTALVKALGDMGFRALSAPIMEIRASPFDADIPEATILILTSQTAQQVLAGAGQPLKGRRAYVVGAAGADMAARAGMQVLGSAATADALARRVLADRPDAPLLHLRGAHSARDIADSLRQAGLNAAERVIYDQRPCSLSERAEQALSGRAPVILPAFSPRSARFLGDSLLAAAPTAPCHLVAISPAAAAAWTGPEPASLHLAARPDLDAMLTAIVAVAGDLN